LLPDRGWPGSRRAQVDLIVIGPAGLFIVDTKAWADVTIAGGHIFRGQDDVTEELENLADLAYSTEQVMAEIGLAPGEIHAVVVLAGRKGIKETVGTVDVVGELDVAAHIARRGQRLTTSQVNSVLGVALGHFPVVGEAAPVNITLTEPVIPADAESIDEADLATLEEVSEALLAGILAAPIEDWMSFLHPDQAKLVRRNFGGPSRIRGSAGTGKTVVGLHRAAYLARSGPGRVLVSTYVKSLPAVLSNLLERMAPEVADRVDFVHAHGFASRVLSDRGIRCSIDPKKTDAIFDTVWRELGANGLLGGLDHNKRYWREEIDSVIKGRGITSFEPYANLARTGRRRQLGIQQRRAVWELYVAYDSRMKAAGLHDFSDMISLAEASLRDEPLEGYTSVIVDEAQDLSCMAIRMLHRLVGNAPDGLTLIGDGRQTIYPGGYSLAEIGISLAGRGVVMNTNYRNTAEILGFATTMVAGDDGDDLEGLTDAAPTVTRTGAKPVVTHFPARAAHDKSLTARIHNVTSEVGTDLGDVAVLALDHYALAPVMLALSVAGIPFVPLDEYTGAQVNAVKVGTIKRAKGLEFKQVLIASVHRSLLDWEPPVEAGALERYEFARRELYVGMTRARDGLWVGVLG
jgi:superfamily I DNA/RNA helicase